jgi:NADPH:quinone reductase-like Zn-dependent oxidoreductase
MSRDAPNIAQRWFAHQRTSAYTGELKPHVQEVLPLQDAAEAQQIVASRRVAGKVVLRV